MEIPDRQAKVFNGVYFRGPPSIAPKRFSERLLQHTFSAVIVYFVEAEPAHQPFFREELAEHEVRFASGLGDVDKDAEAISCFIYSKVDAAFLESHPQLRFIASRAGTVEHIDMAACRKRGITVSWVIDSGDVTVAEHTFALILALSRRLREVMSLPAKRDRFTYEKSRGFDLQGKTIGVIGMGRIGLHVAALARAFRMKVLAHDPIHAKPAPPEPDLYERTGFHELLAASDIISLHVRISERTFHLLDRAALARCKRGALIINTARGRLIDTVALQEALESGQIGGAGLDVLEDERVMRESASKILSGEIVEHLHADSAPGQARDASRLQSIQHLISSTALLERPNVVFTPHVAFNTTEAVDRLNRGTVENLRAYAAGKCINLAE